MLSRFRPRNSAITFDVGAAGIRAVQFTARGTALTGRDALHLELPPAEGNGGDQPSPPDHSRLARLVGQGSFVGSEVALVVSPPDIRFCALRLPKNALAQPEKRVREALAWEVAREMRTEAHELEVRHWELPPGHQQGLNVMAVALPIEQALSWHQMLAREGLYLRRIDVSPCALVRIARRMWTPAAKELWGVLDLGYRRSTLTVVLGGVPAYIRSISISSAQWTRRLAEAFEVAPAGAELIKRDHGIRPVDRGVRAPQPDQPMLDAEDIPAVIFGLLRGPLDDLVHEIDKCFSYVMQNFAEVFVGRLLLAGGGANLRGIAPYLERQLGVPVMPLTSAPDSLPAPWEHPLVNTKLAPETAAAAGGAIFDLEPR